MSEVTQISGTAVATINRMAIQKLRLGLILVLSLNALAADPAPEPPTYSSTKFLNVSDVTGFSYRGSGETALFLNYNKDGKAQQIPAFRGLDQLELKSLADQMNQRLKAAKAEQEKQNIPMILQFNPQTKDRYLEREGQAQSAVPGHRGGGFEDCFKIRTEKDSIIFWDSDKLGSERTSLVLTLGNLKRHRTTAELEAKSNAKLADTFRKMADRSQQELDQHKATILALEAEILKQGGSVTLEPGSLQFKAYQELGMYRDGVHGPSAVSGEGSASKDVAAGDAGKPR